MTETASPLVRYAIDDGVASITLDRPKVNAYEFGLMSELRAAIATVEADAAVTVVVLRSALPEVFSVGADIKVWAASDTTGNRRLAELARANAAAMASSSKIYIAAIGGHALGGGLELALACDLRFGASGDYQLGLPEVKLGLMPGNGGTQRLLRLIGPSQALELLATGEGIDPQRALAMGLLDRLIAKEALERETAIFARSLATGPALALAAIKRSVREGEDLELDEGLALERRLSDGLYDTPDAIEGFAAYVGKRQPRFGRPETT